MRKQAVRAFCSTDHCAVHKAGDDIPGRLSISRCASTYGVEIFCGAADHLFFALPSGIASNTKRCLMLFVAQFFRARFSIDDDQGAIAIRRELQKYPFGTQP